MSEETSGQYQPAGDTAKTAAEFVAHLIQGCVTLLGPALHMIPSSQAPTPDAEEMATALVFEPLRVLQPRVVRGARRLLSRSFIVLALTVGTLMLPTPQGLSPEGHRCLAAFVFTASILALEPVSLPIAALMVPAVQVILGIADTTQAFLSFSRPTVFLILASLFIAEAMRKHGLTRRLAMAAVVLSGGGTKWLLLGVMAIAAGLSMWVENTATAAVLIPVALTISRQLEDPKKARNLLVLLVLGIAYSASLGGMATMMGSASNAVASSFLSQYQSWTFVDWMKYGLPALILIFPVTWWLLPRLSPVDVDRLDVEPARIDLHKQGPMSTMEKRILHTMAVAVTFWVCGSFVEKALNLNPTLLSATMVAVLAVGYLSVRGVIAWEDVKGVSWGIFFTIGAGLSLGDALTRTGVSKWLADAIVPIVDGPHLLVSMLILVFASALLTNVLNNTTIAAVFVPILISLASVDPALDAVQLVLPVTLATTFGYSLPSASGRMALVASTGIVGRKVMLRNGLIMTVVSSIILSLFFYILAVAKLI